MPGFGATTLTVALLWGLCGGPRVWRTQGVAAPCCPAHLLGSKLLCSLASGMTGAAPGETPSQGVSTPATQVTHWASGLLSLSRKGVVLEPREEASGSWPHSLAAFHADILASSKMPPAQAQRTARWWVVRRRDRNRDQRGR